MKRRAAELAQRRAQLLARCEVQREELVLQVVQIAARLEHVDARIDAVRRFVSRPWLLLSAAAAILALLGPRRLLRMGTRGIAWAGAAQRIVRLMQHLRPQLQQFFGSR